MTETVFQWLTIDAFSVKAEDLQMFTRQNKPEDELILRFHNDGAIWWKKLREYIPPMLITNLSTLLLVNIDSVVVGNFVGEKALSSINLFSPIILFVSVICAWVQYGCSTAISNSIGSNDQDKIDRIKRTSIVMMVLAAIVVAIAQIPITYVVMYHGMGRLSDNTLSMMWQYAYGMMIAMPVGVISAVGVCQLQVAGKMKLLVRLAVMEGIANLLLDLLFVGVFDMGVAGAGYGTAGANILRCAMTVYYISKKTEMYKCSRAKVRFQDVRDILSYGLPDAANGAMYALVNFFFIKILLLAFGEEAGMIRAVCTFCFSLVNVVISGIQGGMRPLIGFLSGAKDMVGMRKLLRQCILVCAIAIGAMTVFVLVYPELFFHLLGVDTDSADIVLSLRLFSLYFVFAGIDILFQLYYINRKESRFATLLAVMNGGALIGIAFVLVKLLPAPCVWLTYLITTLLSLGVELWYYRSLEKNDREQDDAEFLYLSLKPQEAVEASRLLRNYAAEHGYSPRLVNRLSLCMEEMVSYAVNASKNTEIRKLLRQKLPPEQLVELLPDELFDKLMTVLKTTGNDEIIPPFPGDVLKTLPKDLQELLQQDVSVYCVVRLTMDEGRLIMMDTGRRIALNDDSESKALVTENYELIKKLAKSVEYQYVMDMNYTVISIAS